MSASAVVSTLQPEEEWLQLPLDEIVVTGRFRKDLGDLAELAESIQTVGLLNPLVVTADRVLVTGLRRLEAVRTLAWEKVSVRVVHLDELLRAEHDENEIRKAFTATERAAIAVALVAREKQLAQERKRAGSSRGGKKQGSSNLEEGKKSGEAKVRAAKAAGMSATTMDKVLAVMKAAEDDPARFGKLPAEMDRTGKVDRSYKEVLRLQGQEPREKKLLTPVQQLAVLKRQATRLEEVDAIEFARGIVQQCKREEAMEWVGQVESWVEAFTTELEKVA